MNGDNATDFDSFGVEYIPKEIFMRSKNMATRIEEYDLVI